MLRSLLIGAILAWATCAAAAIPSVGSSFSSQTPILNSGVTYNFGALTRTGQGGVPLNALLKAANSPPIVSWRLTQTKGGAGYWKDPTTGLTYSGSAVAIPEFNRLSTPTVSIPTTMGGVGYCTNDLLTLNNGALIKVTSGACPAGSALGTNFAVLTAPTIAVAGPATVVSCSTSLGGSCTGSGATFLFQLSTPAQTPTPTTAGAAANLGGNATVMDDTEFTVQAVGADGSLSGTATLKINRIVDAANISFVNAPSATTYMGAGSTSTIQAFANACVNCSGSTGDMKLLISTGLLPNPNGVAGVAPVESGAIGSATQWFPPLGLPRKMQFTNINFGYALQNSTVGGLTPGAANLLTVEDACRATGSNPAGWTPASGHNLALCDGTAGQPSTLEYVEAVGGGSASVDPCDNTSSTSTLTYLAFEGLTFGGHPDYNAAAQNQPDFEAIGACNVWLEYAYANYAHPLDGAGVFSYLGGGIGTNGYPAGVVYYISNYNNHLYVNYLTCIAATYCVYDLASSSGAASLDVQIKHLWAQYFSQNALSQQWSQVQMSDAYLVGPVQFPNSQGHIDSWQLSDAMQPVGVTFHRTYMLYGTGNSFQQGFFGGNYGVAAIPGMVFDGLLYSGNGQTCTKFQSMDSTTTQGQFKHITCVRQIAQFPGINGANGYQSVIFSAAGPQDGDTITVGTGCITATWANCPALPNKGQTSVTITFRNSPSNVQEVQVGASGPATFLNLAAALGVSRDGNSCNGVVLQPLGQLVHACMNNVTNGVGFIISSWPGQKLVYQTIGSSPNCNGCRIQLKGSNFNVSGEDNVLVPYGPTLGFYNTTQSGPSCVFSSVKYCGQALIDSTYLEGGIYNEAGFTYCTPAAAHVGTLNPTYFNVTANNVMGGLGWVNSSTCQGTDPTNRLWNKFVGDGPNNTAEQQLEAISDAAWRAKTPLQICQTYATILTPKAGGDLDPAGNTNLSSVVGALNLSGLWNDGSGLAPCYDLPSGVAYATNPWPH